MPPNAKCVEFGGGVDILPPIFAFQNGGIEGGELLPIYFINFH